MIRRWELVDTRNGESLGSVSRHFTRRGAAAWRRFLNRFLRPRSDAHYELQVWRREGSA